MPLRSDYAELPNTDLRPLWIICIPPVTVWLGGNTYDQFTVSSPAWLAEDGLLWYCEWKGNFGFENKQNDSMWNRTWVAEREDQSPIH